MEHEFYVENSWVYIIRTHNPTYLKIGYSKTPLMRYNNIKISCPLKINIKFLIENTGRLLERQIHHDLMFYREKGEWYKKDCIPALLKILEYYNEFFDIMQFNNNDNTGIKRHLKKGEI
jgi:hypothetical protein